VASISGAPLRSPDAEPVLGTPKMALITTYDLAFSDDDLLVVNVHGINFRTGGAFAAQMAMIERAVASHVGPMILAGDFNTWSSGRKETLTHMTRALGLSPVEPADDERGFLRLDHVFVRGLSVRGARFVNGLDSSDHAPIAVALGALVP
jgi:endonuclease/exonuclease/phosphatase (EEP) superfamily protein YafD